MPQTTAGCSGLWRKYIVTGGSPNRKTGMFTAPGGTEPVDIEAAGG